MTNKNEDTLNILITPQHTLIGDLVTHPETITVVLENGHSFDIETILSLLEKHDKSKGAKWVPFRRTKRFCQAVKIALKEIDSDRHG